MIGCNSRIKKSFDVVKCCFSYCLKMSLYPDLKHIMMHSIYSTYMWPGLQISTMWVQKLLIFCSCSIITLWLLKSFGSLLNVVVYYQLIGSQLKQQIIGKCYDNQYQYISWLQYQLIKIKQFNNLVLGIKPKICDEFANNFNRILQFVNFIVIVIINIRLKHWLSGIIIIGYWCTSKLWQSVWHYSVVQ